MPLRSIWPLNHEHRSYPRDGSAVSGRESLACSTGNVMPVIQGTSCWEHKEGLAWNTGNVLLGKQGMPCIMSCVECRECLAWKIGNVLRGTQGMSCVEHRNSFVEHNGRPAWNTWSVLLETQGMS